MPYANTFYTNNWRVNPTNVGIIGLSTKIGKNRQKMAKNWQKLAKIGEKVAKKWRKIGEKLAKIGEY